MTTTKERLEARPMNFASAYETCQALRVLHRTLSRVPPVPDVLPVVQAFYAMDGNGAGGVLHVVLDDQNTEDSSVRFCLEMAERENDPLAIELCKVLLIMSPTGRGKLASGPKRSP